MAGWGGGSIPYMYICCICYSKLLGSHNDVSVLSKSMMGLKKVLIGGWVGVVSYIHFFNFANPLPQYVVNISQW